MNQKYNNLKLIALFILSSMISIQSFSQLPVLYTSTGFEYGKANAIDSEGNYINTALFQNTINITDNVSLTAQGNGTDIVLSKYDSTGLLLWANRMGGVSADGPHGVGTDANNNIYMTGYFGSTQAIATSNFDPLGSANGNVTSEGGEDAFLAKYDGNGAFQWAFSLGNTGQTTQERTWDIVVDAQGNSYIGGGFWGSMDFNPLGTPNVQSISNGNSGLFLAKYDANGINQWAMVIDANLTNVFAEGYTTFDLNIQEDKIYISGNFRGTNVELNPLGTNSTTANSVGMADMFMASYDANNGHLIWAETIGSVQQDLVAPGALRLDNSDNIWFTGRLSGTNSVDFDPTNAVSLVTNSSLFLASFDANGNFRTALGMDSGIGDGGHRVGFDAQNNVYLAGWMSGTLDFGNGIIKTANSTTADVFIAKYTNNGVCQWVNHFGGNNSTGNSICAGLTVDATGNSYLTGQLYGTDADIDPSSNTKLMSSAGENDCFIIRYDSNGNLFDNTTTSTELIENTTSVLIFPNPANDYFIIENEQIQAAQIQIYNTVGQQLQLQSFVSENQILFKTADLPKGLYFVNIQIGEKVLTRQVLINE